MSIRSFRIWVLVVVFGLAATLPAGDAAGAMGWRQDGSGKFEIPQPPVEWGADRNIIWKTPMQSFSNASPVIVGDKIINLREPGHLICFNKADGKVLWEKEHQPKGKAPKAHGTNGFTSGTPATNGKHVYAMFGFGLVVCYDLAGNKIWEKQLDILRSGHGHCASPLPMGDKVIVQYGHVWGLDAATGEIKWNEQAKGKAIYGTPVAAQVGGNAMVVTPDGKLLNAGTGKVIDAKMGVLQYNAPAVDGNTAYFIQGNSAAFELQAGGVKKLWSQKIKNDRYYSSPLIYKDRVYGVTRGGIATILNAKDGKVVVEKDLKLGRDVYSSVTRAGDFIYILHEKGTTLVVKPGDTFEILHKNKLEQTRCNPVFEGTRMYLRTWKHLYCIGK